MLCDTDRKVDASADKKATFRVSSTTDGIQGVPFYLIESTAPCNVEVPDPPDDPSPAAQKLLKPWDDPAAAIRDIAEKLIPNEEPGEVSLVVMAHGYNNPRPNVLAMYYGAIQALEKDENAIFTKDRRVVCVGYRWPSEGLGSILVSCIKALPLFPLRVLLGAVIFLLLEFFFPPPGAIVWLTQLLTPLAVFLLGLIVFLMALRWVVYFRDIYRATNFGVQDLVEVIRQIDLEASRIVKERNIRDRKRIALSFVGHSMGGLVVTNVIRVLCDVFDPAVIRKDLSNQPRDVPATAGEPLPPGKVTAKVGHVFSLMRFVLASPDIPAEALLAARGNFLESSLARFKEAYLFSNEGDEVLRLISTTANYFSFPTMHRTSGYRLGNVEILSSDFKAMRSDGGLGLLSALRAGQKTLEELSDSPSAAEVCAAASVADAFSYFDCTDYVDDPDRRPYLTEARNYKATNPNGRIPDLEHAKLLLLYVFAKPPRNINVHGGYFEGTVTQRLIYRLACLGFDDAADVYAGETQLLAECEAHQIRVMLSKRLAEQSEAERKHRELIDRERIDQDLR